MPENTVELDAKRYQFLKSCKDLTLSSQKPTKWFREDGSSFISSYYLACNNTSFPGFETLDELIDFAMGLDKTVDNSLTIRNNDYVHL